MSGATIQAVQERHTWCRLTVLLYPSCQTGKDSARSRLTGRMLRLSVCSLQCNCRRIPYPLPVTLRIDRESLMSVLC